MKCVLNHGMLFRLLYRSCPALIFHNSFDQLVVPDTFPAALLSVRVSNEARSLSVTSRSQRAKSVDDRKCLHTRSTAAVDCQEYDGRPQGWQRTFQTRNCSR